MMRSVEVGRSNFLPGFAMTRAYSDGTNAALCAGLGEVVIRWNSIENVLALIISHFAPTHEAAVLTAHMGSTSLCDALRTFAIDRTTEPKRGVIVHFIDFFERMREYRNFYVHGAAYAKDGHIVLSTSSARNGYYLHEAPVDTEDFKALNDTLLQLFLFGAQIAMHLAHERNPPPHPMPRVALPDKLPLPDRLQKPRQSPRSSLRQHQPSPP
jgi:hypothetical protein